MFLDSVPEFFQERLVLQTLKHFLISEIPGTVKPGNSDSLRLQLHDVFLYICRNVKFFQFQVIRNLFLNQLIPPSLKKYISRGICPDSRRLIVLMALPVYVPGHFNRAFVADSYFMFSLALQKCFRFFQKAAPHTSAFIFLFYHQKEYIARRIVPVLSRQEFLLADCRCKPCQAAGIRKGQNASLGVKIRFIQKLCLPFFR